MKISGKFSEHNVGLLEKPHKTHIKTTQNHKKYVDLYKAEW